MARIATDIGSYYEAAYAPVVQDFDGKFRKIDVKVTRTWRDRAEPIRLLRAAARRRLGAVALRDAAAHRAHRRSAAARLRLPGAGAAVCRDAGGPRPRARLRSAAGEDDLSGGPEEEALSTSILDAGAGPRPRRPDRRAFQRRLSLRRPARQSGRRQARQPDLQASLQPARRATTPWTSSRRTATAGAPACRSRGFASRPPKASRSAA